jgi:hypothetical protein
LSPGDTEQLWRVLPKSVRESLSTTCHGLLLVPTGAYLFGHFALSHTFMPVVDEGDDCTWVHYAMEHSVDISPGNKLVDWVMVRQHVTAGVGVRQKSLLQCLFKRHLPIGYVKASCRRPDCTASRSWTGTSSASQLLKRMHGPTRPMSGTVWHIEGQLKCGQRAFCGSNSAACCVPTLSLTTHGLRIFCCVQGYLNYQVIHHLFPTMPQSNGPIVSRELRIKARQWRINYTTVRAH